MRKLILSFYKIKILSSQILFQSKTIYDDRVVGNNFFIPYETKH